MSSNDDQSNLGTILWGRKEHCEQSKQPNDTDSVRRKSTCGKPMPKGLFHGIYLDYLCGCVLRVAREVFALLPVDTVLV